MKIILKMLALAVTLLFTGCQQQNIANMPITTSSPKTTINIDNTTSIHIDSVKGLSCDEVITLCQKVIGTKDDEHFMFQMAERHTDKDVGYRCDGAIEHDGKQYYVLCMIWSSDDDINWSNIGFLGVSADGNKIHELFGHRDGSYSFGKLLWSASETGCHVSRGRFC